MVATLFDSVGTQASQAAHSGTVALRFRLTFP